MGSNISSEEVTHHMNTNILSIEELEDYVETGDIILSHGNGGFAWFTKTLTRCPWTHSAFVVKDKRIQNGTALIWETTRIVKHFDVIRKSEGTGVNLYPIREKIKHYDGDCIVVRKLSVPQHVRNTFYTNIMPILHKYDGKMYDSKFKDVAFTSFCTFPFFKQIDYAEERALFCSELVALTYGELGLLDLNKKPAIEYEPQDFSCSCVLDLPPNCYLLPPAFVHVGSDPSEEHCSKGNPSSIVKGRQSIILSDINEITVV